MDAVHGPHLKDSAPKIIGANSSSRGSLGLGPLDWRSHEIPPLRPGPIVVSDVRVSEEVLQDEPRVRRSLADPAVGDDLFVRRHALRLVEGFQLFDRLECAVLVHRLRPRNVLRSWDVTSALRVLRWIFRRRKDLAREFLRTADIDEDLVRLPICLSDVWEVYSDFIVRFLRLELGR